MISGRGYSAIFTANYISRIICWCCSCRSIFVTVLVMVDVRKLLRGLMFVIKCYVKWCHDARGSESSEVKLKKWLPTRTAWKLDSCARYTFLSALRGIPNINYIAFRNFRCEQPCLWKNALFLLISTIYVAYLYTSPNLELAYLNTPPTREVLMKQLLRWSNSPWNGLHEWS